MKLLILAIDALDWELLNHFSGTPFFEHLRSEGLSGRLAAPPVPLTPVSFGEFYTGQESFLMPNLNLSTITLNANPNLDHILFDDLSEKYRLGLFEMPCMSKLRPIGQFNVAGLTFDEHRAYNREERVIPRKIYDDTLFRYPFYGPVICNLFNIQEQIDFELRRLNYINEILQDYPCDIISVYLRIMDVACHGTRVADVVNHPKEVFKALHELYVFVDEWTNILYQKITKPDAILIFSDHGFRPMEKQGIDWRSHTYDGTYILHGTDQQGSKPSRVWRMHHLVKNICGI